MVRITQKRAESLRGRPEFSEWHLSGGATVASKLMDREYAIRVAPVCER